MKILITTDCIILQYDPKAPANERNVYRLPSIPFARFIIVGDGPDRENLQSLTQSLGIGNQRYKKGHFDLVHYHTVNLLYYFEHLLNRHSTIGIGYVHFLPQTLDEGLKLHGLVRKVFYKYLLAFYNSMDKPIFCGAYPFVWH